MSRKSLDQICTDERPGTTAISVPTESGYDVRLTNSTQNVNKSERYQSNTSLSVIGSQSCNSWATYYPEH